MAMAIDLAADTRLDPRIRRILEFIPTEAPRDVASRDELLAEAATPRAAAVRRDLSPLTCLGHPALAVPSILEPMPSITWMVMSRDVSHSIRVVDQAVTIAVMILDVDTGLIRGLSVAENVRDALSQSVERALNKPADSLPPGYPQRVLAAVGLGDFVAVELGRQPGLNLIPPIDEIVPGDEAEEIFDLFVETFS
jgi:hypothetical protein